MLRLSLWLRTCISKSNLQPEVPVTVQAAIGPETVLGLGVVQFGEDEDCNGSAASHEGNLDGVDSSFPLGSDKWGLATMLAWLNINAHRL